MWQRQEWHYHHLEANMEIAVKIPKLDYHVSIILFPVRNKDPWRNDWFWAWLWQYPRGVWDVLFYLKARQLSKIVMSKRTESNLKGLLLIKDGTILPVKRMMVLNSLICRMQMRLTRSSALDIWTVLLFVANIFFNLVCVPNIMLII